MQLTVLSDQYLCSYTGLSKSLDKVYALGLSPRKSIRRGEYEHEVNCYTIGIYNNMTIMYHVFVYIQLHLQGRI